MAAAPFAAASAASIAASAGAGAQPLSGAAPSKAAALRLPSWGRKSAADGPVAGVVVCPLLDAVPDGEAAAASAAAPAQSWTGWAWSLAKGLLGLGGAPTPVAAANSRARRVLVVGLHGWQLLGGIFSQNQHEATSRKLCALMAEALRDEHRARAAAAGVGEAAALEITERPLATLGTVDVRLAAHFRALAADDLRGYDLVVVAAHSQGSIVAALMLADLLRKGRLNTDTQTVAMLSLAGIHHGPFSDWTLQTDGFSMTSELFDFGRPYSEICKRYVDGMQQLLQRDVKVMCVASWGDEVVPLFSSLMHCFRVGPPLLPPPPPPPSPPPPAASPAEPPRPQHAHHHHHHHRAPRDAASHMAHQNLLRALAIPISSFRQDFLTDLLRACLQLYQLGVRTELPVLLAPYLRRGPPNMHSQIHSDLSVYRTFASWVLRLPQRRVAAPPRRVAVDFHSAAWLAAAHGEGQPLSAFKLEVCALELVAAMSRLPQEALEVTVEALRLAFVKWEPEPRPLQLLRDALRPAFGESPRARL